MVSWKRKPLKSKNDMKHLRYTVLQVKDLHDSMNIPSKGNGEGVFRLILLVPSCAACYVSPDGQAMLQNSMGIDTGYYRKKYEMANITISFF